MIDAGYVGSVQEAFERWLGTGCPAFVTRSGPDVAATIASIRSEYARSTATARA